MNCSLVIPLRNSMRPIARAIAVSREEFDAN
jgi:hypothetical protein